MNSQNIESPKIMKESKNKIKVDFERSPLADRLKAKFLSMSFLGNTIWYIFRLILLIGIAYVVLFPFFTKIAGSFMSPSDIADATVSLIPRNFTLDQYKYIIQDNGYFFRTTSEGVVLGAFFNTLLLSLICAFIQTMVACLIGYGLAKFKFKGNSAVMIAVVVTMIIPHIALKSAMTQQLMNFDLFRVFAWNYKGPIEAIFGETLYLGQTFWPLVMLSATGLAFKNGLYIYLMRQFFKGVPDELEESAYVDGSGVFRTFFQIILPLSVPMMITIFLFSFSWQWTDEFYTNLFWSSGSEYYLMPDIYEYPPKSLEVFKGTAGWTQYKNVIQNTAGLLIIAPLVIIYLFCQRYLVQGIERSGLVG